MPADKNELRAYREKFKKTCNLRVEKCLDLVEKLRDPSSLDVPKAVASLDDELTAMEGETQLLDFQDLAGLFTVLIETLRSPPSQKKPASLRRGLNAVGPLLDRWTEGGSTEGMTEGIVAALREHIDKVAAEEAKPAAPKGEHHTRRIIFIDDSEITREMIRAALVEVGHVVQVAENLLNFDQRLAEFRPDIILTDVNMPDIRGDEICKVLKTKYDTADIPILLFSSKDTDELAELAERAGADGFVSKQQGFDKLIEKIDELVGEILW
ncbi:PleD family two-component system response regulator [Myxococcota bacterium]